MKRTSLIGVSLALLACLTVAAGLFNNVADAAASLCNPVVVTNDDVARQPENTPPTRNWVVYTRNAGTGTFRTGPGTPPLGIGSFETATPTGSDKVTLFNYDHKDTRLADITSLGYSTYISDTNQQQAPALNLEVDFNGPNVAGGFTTLVFEPIYNLDQGNVQADMWQSWDAFNGGNAKWWSTKSIPGVCAFDCFVSWQDIVAANPDAVIVGGYGINQGSGNPSLVASSDALNIGYTSAGNDPFCITYNFEPYRVATTKESCKDNGWKTLRRADGSSFKNQGDCVSYTNNGK